MNSRSSSIILASALTVLALRVQAGPVVPIMGLKTCSETLGQELAHSQIQQLVRDGEQVLHLLDYEIRVLNGNPSSAANKPLAFLNSVSTQDELQRLRSHYIRLSIAIDKWARQQDLRLQIFWHGEGAHDLEHSKGQLERALQMLRSQQTNF